MKDNHLQQIIFKYPFLNSPGSKFIQDIEKYGTYKQISKGEYIFLENDKCNFFSFILSGEVRVFKAGESGREITLYRFGVGESCILTLSCLLGKNTFPAIAVTEDEIEAILVPSGVIREWFTSNQSFRDYAFDTLSRRLSDVIMVINEIAFKRVDARVSEYILNNSDKDSTLTSTHKKIAVDLGTSREVISRVLKEMETNKILNISRGKINVIDSEALKKLSKNVI